MIDCTKTEQYFAEKQRMVKLQTGEVCEISCEECPLSSMNNGEDIVCSDFETCYPEKAIAIVQKWSDEHPQKTYLSEFLKHYPNAPLDDEGAPKGVCPHTLGLMDIDNCDDNCIKCWNQPVEESEK
ncbi:hypothetical protein [Ruminococcus bromii]|uniref:hypothetical protein n=1 Tax=Ruminococcus bromii TaxID=40518 RepID=UPI002659C9D0|nr:hypothetical protein [Ruminococcus bromii]